MLARALGWSRGMLGEIFEDGEGGHGEDLLLPISRIVLRSAGRRDRSKRRRPARHRASPVLRLRVRRRAAQPRGFFNGGLQLLLGVLIRRGELSVFDRVCAGFVDLDEVRAFFELLTHDGHEFVGAVGVVALGRMCCAGL